MKKHMWTNKERAYLKKHYPNKPTKEVAEVLGVSLRYAYMQASLLGLTKSDKYRAQELQRQAVRLRVVGVAYRIKKGQEPPNKGRKQSDYMTKEAIARTAKTQFKKGTIPPNYQPVGYERMTIDGYTEIKTGEGLRMFKLKHRVEWEKVNGNIPRGLILVCKTDDKQNCHPSNWELITRAENMKRNTYHNYPKDIANVIQLRGALTRQINKAKRRYEK